MSSEVNNQTGRVFVPFDFLSKIQSLLDEMSRPLTKPKKYKPIITTLKTSDKRKIKIDLNICRPSYSSNCNREMSHTTVERKEDLEDLIIVWLDQNIDGTENEFSVRENDLRQIINCLVGFSDVKTCFEYIKSIIEEKIFLIVSGSLGKRIINEINQYSQVLSVYIYCSNTDYHENWIKNSEKVVGSFTTEHDLITQIAKDVSSFYQGDLSINVINSNDTSEKSLEDLTKSQAQFMWSQVLMETLLHLPQTSKSKQELIAECRRRYKHNNSQQNQINEFEKTYTSSNALSWYTRDSFLYRIINKALRTRNMIYIFKCRFFIIDLFQQLTQSYVKLIESVKQKTLTVYRGQLMAADEFSKLRNNINGLVSINTFFSTSTSSDAVFPFTGDGNRRPLFESIFFEIELHLDMNKMPFAEMSSHSNFESENEVVLCFGSVLRIEFIDKLTDDLWHVKLISTNENDYTKLNNLANYLKKDRNETLPCLALGRILQKMGEYDKAQTLYETLLAELPSNHPDMAGIYNDIAMALFKSETNWKIVLNYLIQSLQLQIKTFPKYFLFFTQCLSNIASVYIKCRNYKRALSLLHLTLQVLDLDCSAKTPHAIHLQRSEIHNNIGNLYLQRGQSSLSLKHLQISLKIAKKILPTNHPDIALAWNNIGTIYLKKLSYQQAEKCFLEASSIAEESLPFEQHPDIAQVYNNRGLLECNRGNYDKALIHYKKALQIQLKCLPAIHWKTAALYNNIGHVYFERAEYSQALQMFEKSANIEQQCMPPNHSKLCHTYQYIGNVYRSLQDYPNALINCTKALEIGCKYLPAIHFEIARAYHHLGCIYNDLENYLMAMYNFQKARSIYLENPPKNKSYLGTLYEDIGIGYYNTEQYNNSLENLQKALEIFRTCDEKEVDKRIRTAQELMAQIKTLQTL